jgi:hypothetical protein
MRGQGGGCGVFIRTEGTGAGRGVVPLDMGGHGGMAAEAGWTGALGAKMRVGPGSGPTDGTAGARAAWSLLGPHGLLSARVFFSRRWPASASVSSRY